MNCGLIDLSIKMRQSIVQFSLPANSSLPRSLADVITSTVGSDFRYGQRNGGRPKGTPNKRAKAFRAAAARARLAALDCGPTSSARELATIAPRP